MAGWLGCLALTLLVDAPAALEAAAARVRAVDAQALDRALAGAGLEMPAAVRVVLVPEDDDRARRTPRWVVGRAFPPDAMVIFPARVSAYPYDSLEAVVRHEIVHLALGARAAQRPLPRWFHEGVATSVGAGWGAAHEMRLAFAALSGPTIDDLTGLFASAAQPDTELAYLLAAVLVDDLRRRQGSAAPGRIAARVGEGVPFERAFAQEAGMTPDAAAAQAWATYRRWRAWTPLLTSVTSAWTLILLLAFIAYFVRLRRRALRRRQWDEEEMNGSADAR